MANPSPVPRISWRDWLPVMTIIMTLTSAILVCGGYLNEMKEHERRIAALELRAGAQDQMLQAIQITTTRTDATLQALRDKRGELQP